MTTHKKKSKILLRIYVGTFESLLKHVESSIYGLEKGTDILLKQIQCSNIGKCLNIIALHWPVICYCWAFTYSVSRRRASLDRRSTTPHVLMT